MVQDSGKTLAEAVAQVQAALGLSASPMTDFTAAGAAADVGLAARAVGAIVIETSKRVAGGGVGAAAVRLNGSASAALRSALGIP